MIEADILTQYGLQGLMLAWFMLRTEKVINSNTKALTGFSVVIEKCKKKK